MLKSTLKGWKHDSSAPSPPKASISVGKSGNFSLMWGRRLGLKVLFALCFPFTLDFKIIYPDTVIVEENVSSKLPHIQKLNGPKVQIPTL